MSSLRTGGATTLLGYPADARLLIINADDFGMCHAINAAILRSLRDGIVCSTTLMVPCPWALHAMHLLAEHPDISFGIHLTVVCEASHYRWGPLTCREKVPSLVDETGYFYSLDRIPAFLAQVKMEELEVEFRAQIETVLAANLHPTHLDWHALSGGGGTAEMVELMLRLAHEYGLAMRVAELPWINQLQQQGLPTNDHDFLDSFDLDTVDKAARYAELLHDLPIGWSEWAVHPGIDDAEMRAISHRPEVRQTDFDFLISAEARGMIEQEGITLLSYQPLQHAWRAS